LGLHLTQPVEQGGGVLVERPNVTKGVRLLECIHLHLAGG
jgi:hypothetical protein